MTNQDNATAADPAAEWTSDRRYRHLLRCAIAFLLPGRMHKVAGQTRAEVAHQLQVMLADVESFVTAQPDAHSLVGLSQGDGTVLAADIDQRVPALAAGAEKVDAVAVDLGRHGGEHDLKAAASALPHHGAPVDCQDRSADEPSLDNYILDVHLVTRDGGSYCVRCPHCKELIGIDGDDLSEVRGEQYQHRACTGWLQVSHSARYVKELPAAPAPNPKELT